MKTLTNEVRAGVLSQIRAAKAGVLEYITLGTVAYAVVQSLVKLLRAKRINRNAVLAQLTVLFEQVTAIFGVKISLDTIEKCMDAVLGVVAEVRR